MARWVHDAGLHLKLAERRLDRLAPRPKREGDGAGAERGKHGEEEGGVVAGLRQALDSLLDGTA